jgi:hypothetical protein
MIPRYPVEANGKGTGMNGDLPMEFVLGKTPDLGNIKRSKERELAYAIKWL